MILGIIGCFGLLITRHPPLRWPILGWSVPDACLRNYTNQIHNCIVGIPFSLLYWDIQMFSIQTYLDQQIESQFSIILVQPIAKIWPVILITGLEPQSPRYLLLFILILTWIPTQKTLKGSPPYLCSKSTFFVKECKIFRKNLSRPANQKLKLNNSGPASHSQNNFFYTHYRSQSLISKYCTDYLQLPSLTWKHIHRDWTLPSLFLFYNF